MTDPRHNLTDKAAANVDTLAAAELAAEGAMLGARARAKAEAEGATETAALAEAVATGRRVTWQRGGAVDPATGRRRMILMAEDPATYTAADLATLAEAAATRATAAARRGRLVKGPNGPQWTGRVTLTDGEAEALAAEAVALALTAADALALPKRGAVAEAVAPGDRGAADRIGQAVTWTPRGATEAVSVDAGDLAALTAALSNMIRNAGRGDQARATWRDCAEALRAAASGGPLAAEAAPQDTAAADILASAQAEAEGQGGAAADPATDAYLAPPWTGADRRPLSGGDPLASDTRLALAASGLPPRQRMAVAQALAADRAAAAHWAATGRLAPEAPRAPGHWHKRTDQGRAALRAALRGAEAEAVAQALAAVADAEDGRTRADRAEARAEAEARLAPCPSGSAALALARRLAREAAPDALAARLARVYREAPRLAPDGRPAALTAASKAQALAAQAEATEGRAVALAEAVARTAPEARADGDRIAQAQARIALAREALAAQAEAAAQWRAADRQRAVAARLAQAHRARTEGATWHRHTGGPSADLAERAKRAAEGQRAAEATALARDQAARFWATEALASDAQARQAEALTAAAEGPTD
jgi:hypothetical protein